MYTQHAKLALSAALCLHWLMAADAQCSSVGSCSRYSGPGTTCSGVNSCSSVNITSGSTQCSGTTACNGGSIDSPGTCLACSGTFSCYNLFVNVSSLSCTGSQSCSGIKLGPAVRSIQCGGSIACQSMRMKNSSFRAAAGACVSCQGQLACQNQLTRQLPGFQVRSSCSAWPCVSGYSPNFSIGIWSDWWWWFVWVMVLSVCLGVCRRQRRNSLLFRQRNDAVVGTSIYSTTAATATMAVPSVYVPVSTPNGATAYAPQPVVVQPSQPVGQVVMAQAYAKPYAPQSYAPQPVQAPGYAQPQTAVAYAQPF